MPFGEGDKLCKLLDEMVDEAEATYEVSMAMLMKRSRLKVCERVVADAIHKRGYWFKDGWAPRVDCLSFVDVLALLVGPLTFSRVCVVV